MANLAEMKQANTAKTDLSTMKPKDQIAHILKAKQAEIQKMLPKHLNAERLLKVAQIAATTTPALLTCDVPSLIGAIGQCAQMGLEPNTVLGHAYLVPFNVKRKDGNGVERWVNSVQVVIGYKGLIDLARRSGQIVSIAAHEVCEKDSFEIQYGLDEKLNHTPSMGERGEVIGFYAVAKFVGGGYSFEFMSRHEVERIMLGTQSKGKYGPWKDHFTEMGRKTVIRRLAKYLPLSIEFQTAVALDNSASTENDQHLDNTLDGDFNFVKDDDAAMYGDGEAEVEQTAKVQQVRPSPRASQLARNDAPIDLPGDDDPGSQQQEPQRVSFATVSDRMLKAKDIDILDAEADLIKEVDAAFQDELRGIYMERRAALENPPPANRTARARPAMNLE